MCVSSISFFVQRLSCYRLGQVCKRSWQVSYIMSLQASFENWHDIRFWMWSSYNQIAEPAIQYGNVGQYLQHCWRLNQITDQILKHLNLCSCLTLSLESINLAPTKQAWPFHNLLCWHVHRINTYLMKLEEKQVKVYFSNFSLTKKKKNSYWNQFLILNFGWYMKGTEPKKKWSETPGSEWIGHKIANFYKLPDMESFLH